MSQPATRLFARKPAAAPTSTGIRRAARDLPPWLAVLSPLILVGAWSALSYSGLFPREIVVPPDVIWQTFVTKWMDGELPTHLGNSLLRLTIGYAAGAGVGIALGAAMGASRQAEAYLMPSFMILRQLPTIALIPAFILLFGVGETVKIVLVAKATALPVALGTFQGVRGIPRGYLDVARVFRIGPVERLFRVILPAILPALFQGLRTSLSHAWVILVAAELLIADNGLGQMMEWGRQSFRLDIVLLGVVITGLVGFGLDKGFRLLERAFTVGRPA